LTQPFGGLLQQQSPLGDFPAATVQERVNAHWGKSDLRKNQIGSVPVLIRG
jgi:hypothetical protein